MTNRGLEFYATKYDHVRLSRTDGVLLAELHTDGGELRWGGGPHDELGHCFADIAADPENEVVILTGTGDAFIGHFATGPADRRTPDEWRHVHADGKRLLTTLLDIPVPMIAAINGPATVHAELGLLCDIVLAADTAVFSDAPHFDLGVVPGDGVHVVWPLLLGPNRGRYFLLTGETLTAEQALDLQVVSEVLPPDALMGRARELAAALLRRPPLTRRYTREALVQPLKRALLDGLSHGLALEGLAAMAHWPQNVRHAPAPRP